MPDEIGNQNMEEKVIKVLNKIKVSISSSVIEACHCIGKSENLSK